MIDEFIREMGKFVPDDSRLMFCQFRGDPNVDLPGKWRAKVLTRSTQLDEKANVYFCVSAMRRNARGEFRRRKENFAGGLLLMIDDIGDGQGAKFPISVLDPLPPTCLVETSPDNFQAIYFFDELIADRGLMDGLISAFIQRQFLSQDTGMAGVNRVFRPPFGINGKEKYGGWAVRCAAWNPELRYSVDELCSAFDLTIVPHKERVSELAPESDKVKERLANFRNILTLLDDLGLLKRKRADISGWIPIVCPWTEEHSDRADTGAAIRKPHAENEWVGGFRCHHAHCEDKTILDLQQWAIDCALEEIENLGE